jgi:prevent-host-death family protein
VFKSVSGGNFSRARVTAGGKIASISYETPRAGLVLLLLQKTVVRNSSKSLPTPVADARKNFSDVVEQARNGQRIKLTRHGRSIAWIVGATDRESLKAQTRTKPRAKRARRG